MLEKINNLIKERFMHYGDYITLYDENDVALPDAIIELFEKEEFLEQEYSIITETVFDNPAIEVGYISVAFVDYGRLHHETYAYEIR